jgi:hypothetical protein
MRAVRPLINPAADPENSLLWLNSSQNSIALHPTFAAGINCKHSYQIMPLRHNTRNSGNHLLCTCIFFIFYFFS